MPPTSRRPRSRQAELFPRSKRTRIEISPNHRLAQITEEILHSNALKIGTTEGVTGKAASLLTHAAKTFGLKATSGITIGGGNTTINASNAPATRVSGSGSGELGAPGSEPPKDPAAEKTRNANSGGGAGPQVSGSGSAASAGPVLAGGIANAPILGTSFVAIAMVDQDNQPFGGHRFLVKSSDGTEHPGTLGADGKARVEGIPPGNCEISFPDLAPDDWGPA